MKRIGKGAVILVMVLGVGCLTSGALAGEVFFEFNAADFSSPTTIDNAYWPLVTGTTFIYEAMEDDELLLNYVTVTGNTKVVCGLDARIVYDREWICDESGEECLLEEETFDWYAQDDFGNIWYLGEETYARIYDEETGDLIGIETEGSWEGCVDGAVPGVVMPVGLLRGSSYQQEYYEGEAEDKGKILRVEDAVSTVLGEFEAVLKTKEWTPLSPGEVEHKYYAPGVGLVLIQELKGKTVWVELTEILGP